MFFSSIINLKKFKSIVSAQNFLPSKSKRAGLNENSNVLEIGSC